MAATSPPVSPEPGFTDRLPRWSLLVLPLLLIAGALAAFVMLDAPGLGDRNGVPIEELVIERTVLEPGVIELTVRNDGPDPVTVAQVTVNDAFVGFEGARGEIDRLGTTTVRIPEAWIEGQAYAVGLVTSTGATIVHQIDAAAETPELDAGFFGLMALLGIYVGVIPVTLGMLWLPWVRRIPASWLAAVMAATVGLLIYLGIDALFEGLELAAVGAQAFGGGLLVFVGAIVAYLALAGVGEWLGRRGAAARDAGADPWTLALLVAVGIGLHNLGEGLAIGSAYATGALALGAFLVVGFALHNTTEGLAIVAPVAERRASLRRLLLLGLLAGGPAVIGAWIGAAAFNTNIAAFLFGAGVGAIAQVCVQLAPALRDATGKIVNPISVLGVLAGMGVMYGTGLLVAA